MNRPRKAEDRKAGAPGWIVTFSDMITLLLTFFVLLLSMAETQVDDHKYMAGRAALLRAFADFGLNGFIVNRTSGPEMDYPQPKYNVDEGQDEKQDRSVDSETEMLRRILMDIETMMKISPSQIAGLDKKFLQTNISFSRGSAELSQEVQKKLAALSEQLQINYGGQSPILYVLGLAADEPNKEKQWILSADRAQAVADDLKARLSKEGRWSIFCWGAGAGGQWTGYSGQVTERTQILITVLTEAPAPY
jgi:chemotaxis protein MotB